jgi:hypothetical protein
MNTVLCILYPPANLLQPAFLFSGFLVPDADGKSRQKTKMTPDSQISHDGRTVFEVSSGGVVEQDDGPDGICTVDSTDTSTNKKPLDKITRATYVFAFCAALNSAIIGYDTGVSTDAARKVQITFDLTDVERELFVGCLNFFASKLFLLER